MGIIKMNISERMKDFSVPGVSIARIEGGKTLESHQFGVLEAGTNKVVTGNSIFHACSISKMVTALCVVRLAQAGKVDLYRDLGDGVTLAALLAHCAGGEFEYSDEGYSRVARVVEEATGEAIPELAERLIFKPLGLKRTFFWDNLPEGVTLDECAVGHDKAGAVVPEIRMVYPNVEGAGLWSTPTELAKIAMTIEPEMCKPYGSVKWAGLGVFLGENAFMSQGWGVGMQCRLRVDTARHDCVVVMINSDPGVDQDASIVGEIIKNFRRA